MPLAPSKARFLVLLLPLGLVTPLGAQGQPPPVMSLPALLGLFQVPAGAPDGSILGWTTGTGGESRIRWAFEGIQEAEEYAQREGFPYHRVGLVVVSLKGQPAYRMEYRGREVPGAWRVTLLGPRAGPFKVSVATEGDAQVMDLDVPAVLREAGWTVSPYKCSRETSPATFGFVVHVVEAPGAKPIWLQEDWNFGQAIGMRVGLELLYFKDQADKVECVER
ncbi:MAG: hypothetical protein ABR551_14445 [Gemmatimonadales bacterium]